MYDTILRALISSARETLQIPDLSDESLVRKQDFIMENSEKQVDILMQEVDVYLRAITEVEGKFGKNDRGFKLFSVFPFVRLAIADLHILNYYLTKEKNEYRQKYLFRAIGLNIYELCEDVSELLGKNFRESLFIFPNRDRIMEELNRIGREFNVFKKKHLSSLKDIRHLTIAHREKNVFKQKEITDKLDFLHQGIQSFMMIAWFEDFIKIEQLILDGIRQSREAKEFNRK